jgi:peptide/nickel transport system permease protein
VLKYAGKRLLAIIPILLIVSFISFSLVELAPGDAAAAFAGDQATSQQIAEVRHALELDKPFASRYVSFVHRAATGDLGSSLFNSQRVTKIIGDRVWTTISLVVVALFFAFILGASAGIYAALHRGSLVDRLLSVVAGLALAVPSFVASIFLLRWFALERNWLPAGGYADFSAGPAEWFRHLVLPASALALFPAAELARLVRTSVADTLGRDYIQTAIAKGLPFRKVVAKHSLKNAAIPVVTVLGVQTGRLLGGAVIIEHIFNLGGLGDLTVNAVVTHDVPIIQGVVLFSAVVVIAINLLVDLSYAYFNPKLRR